MRLAHLAATGLLLAAAFAADANAADYYVDVVNGDDANTGTAPNDAFRTITHALTSTSSAWSTRILIAPGTYGTATGETFPLDLWNRTMIGLDGSAVTHLDGTGTTAQYLVYAGDGSTIEGLSLRNGMNGIGVVPGSLAGWTFRELHLRDLTSRAIDFFPSSFGGPVAQGHLVDVHVRDSGEGVVWSQVTGSGNAEIDIIMEDCTMVGNNRGARFSVSGYPGWSNIRIRRCSFVNNHAGGLIITPETEGRFELEDNLFADNYYGGCYLSPWGGANTTFLVLRNTAVGNNSTVVNDPSANGIYVHSSSGPATGEVAYNICWDNYDTGAAHTDLGAPPGVSVHDNIVGAGPMIGSNGNVSVDPRFVDPAQGDYRLAADSPAVDAYVGSAGELDLRGLPRNIDGDLDGVAMSDYGAFEHRSLECPDEVSIGGTLEMELFSPGLGSARVFGSRVAPFDPPLPTVFGELYIHRVENAAFGAVSSGPSSPGTMSVPIPAQSSLIGKTLTFQALTTTSAGPTNWRLTNHRVVTITP